MNALIVVDVQNDFCEGGALEVPNATVIIPVVNRLMKKFELVILTQDWHPKNHKSFFTQHYGKKPGDIVFINGREQILWPEHCIQNTKGAQFHPLLEINHKMKIFRKGEDPLIDSYSAFYDNFHLRSTGLCEFLRDKKVDTTYLCGLATDYCVKFSALDALSVGFKVYVVVDGCHGVNLDKDDSEKAFKEMEEKGAILIHSKTVN